MKKFEVVVCISYEIEADSKGEAMDIAETIFYEDTHPEIGWFDVNPIHDEGWEEFEPGRFSYDEMAANP